MIPVSLDAENIKSPQQFDSLCWRAIYAAGELDERLAKARVYYEVYRVNFPAYIAKVSAILEKYSEEDLLSRFDGVDIGVYFSNEEHVVSFELKRIVEYPDDQKN